MWEELPEQSLGWRMVWSRNNNTDPAATQAWAQTAVPHSSHGIRGKFLCSSEPPLLICKIAVIIIYLMVVVVNEIMYLAALDSKQTISTVICYHDRATEGGG